MTWLAIYDLTGIEPDSRYQDIAGTVPSTDRIGRVTDLSDNGLDLTALNDSGRPKAYDGYALYDDYPNHRLASDAFPATGADTYAAIRFRMDAYNGSGNTLIAVGGDQGEGWLCGERGANDFKMYPGISGSSVPGISTSSGDHSLEIFGGTPTHYSLDGGALTAIANNWTGGLQRIVAGGRSIGISNRSWRGRIYRAVFRTTPPSNDERARIQSFLSGGPNPITPPPTDEEVFRASFEAASGRDPLPTALLARTPARQLAGHNVNVYRYPPYLVTKRLPIRLEDYDLTKPGLMMWHRDPRDPLFRMGRWAQIQGRRFTDSPLEVELTLRISDHPESFEAPT